ncbi:MAG: hypothetical protein HQL24_06780 [Candidatus Omnitrophica bacterium]|nr:hypothetical protein [Candidatus Omnitrophota bacterium]
MSIIDRILDSLIKYLQKTKKDLQKKRCKRPKKTPAKVKVRPKSLPKPQRKPAVKLPQVKKEIPPKAKKVSVSSVAQKPKMVLIGDVTHFFPRIEVAVVKITGADLKVGDEIRIQSGEGSFTQKVDSMQRESVDVSLARKGQLIGLKVKQEVKAGFKVFKLS